MKKMLILGLGLIAIVALGARQDDGDGGGKLQGEGDRLDARDRDRPAPINLGNRIISSTHSTIHNIDADDDSNGEAFIIAKDRFGDTGGEELLRVLEDGRVGIGTNTPLARLHVAGSGIASMRAANDTAQAAAAFSAMRLISPA